ncbi:MAG TPA: histidine phosphatase family protein [Candidatus Paceibacterota bacterium]|jgi:probable phosphoglycerate mutase|nr:histidine phosphatase family protein [Candidatus Paceibacterota bacterium]
MKLVFVRHGQTDYNKQGIVQGQEKDPPLNAEGTAQVEKTALRIPAEIDRIISSPLKRALQTAGILNKRLNKSIEVNDELKEFKYGSLAGKTWAEIVAVTGDEDVYEKDSNVTFDYRPYGGESAQDVKTRVSGFVDEAKKKYPAETILITAHGGIIDTMHVLFPRSEREASDNASVHQFEF